MSRTFPLIGMSVLAGAHLWANTFIFATANGATESGLPVSVTATFDIEPTYMTVTVQNLQANPTAVDQALAFVTFGIAANVTGMTFTSSAKEATINGNTPGDYSTTAAAPTQWYDSGTGSLPTLIGFCDINGGSCLGQGGQWPGMTLIGPPNGSNAYSSANGSLTNGAHNPFLWETESFTITGTGMPSNSIAPSTITNVVFGFGTSGNENQTGVFLSESASTPEPGPAILLVSGVALLALGKRRRSAGPRIDKAPPSTAP